MNGKLTLGEMMPFEACITKLRQAQAKLGLLDAAINTGNERVLSIKIPHKRNPIEELDMDDLLQRMPRDEYVKILRILRAEQCNIINDQVNTIFDRYGVTISV